MANIWHFQYLVSLATRWCHLHKSQFWRQGGATCIVHCLGLLYWHYRLVSSCCLHQPESHQLSLKSPTWPQASPALSPPSVESSPSNAPPPPPCPCNPNLCYPSLVLKYCEILGGFSCRQPCSASERSDPILKTLSTIKCWATGLIMLIMFCYVK